MADLAALQALHAWMRTENVLYARMGDLELRLGPPVSVPIDTPPQSPEDAEREAYETLLYSSGADPTPFLTRRQ